MMQVIKLNNLRENVFFLCLLLFVALLPFSEAFVSITAGILILQAVALFSWKHPSVPHGSSKNLLLILSVFIIYMVGTICTQDLPLAIYEWKKVIFWIIIPLAFFVSPILSKEKFIIVLVFFCLSVLIATMTGIIKLLFSNYFQITEFRKIILISHIRFSFQIVLAIIVITWMLFSKTKIPAVGYRPVILILVLIWLINFLFLLKSITGIFAFAGTLLVFIIFLIANLKNLKKRILLFLLLITVILAPVIYIGLIWYEFYDTDKIDPQSVDKISPAGNPYSFDFNSKEKENGHWVGMYLCVPELRREWNNRSHCKFDSLDKQGYPYSATLIRYLTSKGLRKDSTGLSKLKDKDIRAVENGLANHIYVDHPFSLYPRIYETIWELDVYFRLGDPNFQSVSQRIEFFKASLLLIKKNPWFGIGTGNWKIYYSETYRQMNSKLYPENQGPSHNQYLNYVVKFGIIGFLYIVCAILIPVFREQHRKNLIFLLFLVSIGVANLGDANLESHMGLSFFTFFYSLFLWHTPPEIRLSQL
jgi:hypothetical protein